MVEDSLAAWHGCGLDFPQLGSPYSSDEQRCRECQLDDHLDAIDAEVRKTSRGGASAQAAIARVISLFARISTDALNLDDPYMEGLLRDGLSGIGSELARRARSLDPKVSMVDILQAARNAWTACGLQLLFGKELRLTPAIFAYSMLYPYSDNLLDDTRISRGAKVRFSERFRRRLEGDSLDPEEKREELIWQLIGMIESEYPRGQFPQVYASLLAIHAAQHESIMQMRRSENIDLVRLTFTKGGTSVLADAYLAAGNLAQPEARFAFNWGVVLQLGDDLQDLDSDHKRGSQTLFTQTVRSGPLDAITNRTFHFSRCVMAQMAGLPNAAEVLKQLVARSSRLLLIRNAANAPGAYTRSYLAELERYSPLGFDFLRNREHRFVRRRQTYTRLFEQVARALPEKMRVEAPGVLMSRDAAVLSDCATMADNLF